MNDSVILIPVRLKATRFPNKPFAKIAGIPMLHFVYKATTKSFSNVYLAICDNEVEDYCTNNDLQYIYTNPSHISGTDRIGEAVEILEKKLDFSYIINVQGDMPFIRKEFIEILRKNLSSYQMSTLACPFKDKPEAENPSKVKVEMNDKLNSVAKDFSRELKDHHSINENIFHHIGIYGYQKKFLKDFISQKPSKREILEKLEQLRVLDNTQISVTLIEQEILGVDTREDLDKVNQLILKNE